MLKAKSDLNSSYIAHRMPLEGAAHVLVIPNDHPVTGGRGPLTGVNDVSYRPWLMVSQCQVAAQANSCAGGT